VLNLLGQK